MTHYVITMTRKDRTLRFIFGDENCDAFESKLVAIDHRDKMQQKYPDHDFKVRTLGYSSGKDD